MENKKYKAVILGNELPEDHLLWVHACSNVSDLLEYRIVDLTANNWFDKISDEPFDILLAKPSCITSAFKQLYDERIYVLNKICGYKVFPSINEILIYENKRLLSFWLRANDIPHPKTNVFYSEKEAKDFAGSSKYPVVAKVGIGASGSGVRILKSRNDAMEYIERTFSGKGAPRRTGPNLSQGNLAGRAIHYAFHPFELFRRLSFYKQRSRNPQKDYVLFQEFIPHDFEWRAVRIGDSFFAHKKLKAGEKASGSLLKGYDNPPPALFDFVRKITDDHGFFSQAIDLFESPQGYLVNEMQCIFGQSDPYQMLIDGKAGRYVFKEARWVFEPGDFNTNESYDLRVQFVLEHLRLSGNRLR
jgi:glutathione synthase/RimK-type ligase-like ATP-grasp enzyme